MAVGEDLRRLKGDVKKDKQKNKRPALRDSPRRRDKGAEKSPVKKARKSRSRSKKDRKKERPAGSKEKGWFGKKAQHGRSSGSRSRRSGKRRARSNSREAPASQGQAAERRARSWTEAPGIGKAMEFGKEKEEDTDSETDDWFSERGPGQEEPPAETAGSSPR